MSNYYNPTKEMDWFIQSAIVNLREYNKSGKYNNQFNFKLMNQQTLQKIYKAHQPKEYYSRYFNHLKLREDSRQFSQMRDMKVTIRPNTVAVSKGQTIVICQLSTQVTIQKSYGKPLLNIKVKFPSAKGLSARQNRPSCSVQEFVSNKIDWRQVQDQLVVKQTGNRYFAHIGDIQLRIVSNDGSLNEVCLMALQLLLWTNKFQKIDSQTGQFKKQSFLLEIPYFYYPSKYCEIIDQLLVDPTLTQEENSSYIVTLVGDLLSQRISESFTLIQKIRKNCDKIPHQVIESILSMWKVQMSKLTFDIKDMRRRINDPDNIQQSIDLLISQ